MFKIAFIIISAITSTLNADCPTPIPTATATSVPQVPSRELFDKRIPEAMKILAKKFPYDIYSDYYQGDITLRADGRDKDFAELEDGEFAAYILDGHIEDNLTTITFVGWDNEDGEEEHMPAKILYEYNKFTGKQYSYFENDKYWTKILFNEAFSKERRYPIQEGQIWERDLSDILTNEHVKLRITSCGWKEDPANCMDSYFIKTIPDNRRDILDVNMDHDRDDEVKFLKGAGRYYINGVFLTMEWHLVRP